jgi:peptidyl-tRNA hydrolase, PTH1 family
MAGIPQPFFYRAYSMQLPLTIIPKVIIGLGNPGSTYALTRHNIGFRVIDALARAHGASWKEKDKAEIASITINDRPVLLIKPQTFMNNSGAVVPFLTKQGIRSEDALVVHDELEFPFGKLAFRPGGSARGHNGLRSLIASWGEGFGRLRFGIGRPERKEDVPNYVLQTFKERPADIEQLIAQAQEMIESLYQKA